MYIHCSEIFLEFHHKCCRCTLQKSAFAWLCVWCDCPICEKEIFCKIFSALRLKGMKEWDRSCSNVYLAFASQPWSALLPNFCSFSQFLQFYPTFAWQQLQTQTYQLSFWSTEFQRKLGELLWGAQIKSWCLFTLTKHLTSSQLKKIILGVKFP